MINELPTMISVEKLRNLEIATKVYLAASSQSPISITDFPNMLALATINNNCL